MQIFKPALLNINRQETKRYAGLQKTVFNEKLIEAACMEAQLLAKPQAVWEIYDYSEATHTVLAEKSFTVEGKSIQKHLVKAKKIIFLAATLGKEVEQAISAHFNEGEYVDGVLLDAAATTAIEQTADALEHALSPEMYKRGYSMRWRFSPGYGDWHIKNQPEVMRLANAEKIGITLTESLMLQPRKSITAVIGLVPESADCIITQKGCATCSMPNCISRKI